MKTVIWDYNGTIIDDTELSWKIEIEMLKERNLPAEYTLEDYRRLFNMPMSVYYRQIGYTFENETFEEVAKEFNDIYKMYFDTCRLNEGVLDVLEQSVKKGYQNIILSSCEHHALVEQCEKLNISSYFETIQGIDDFLGGSKIEHGKAWMKKNYIDPHECMFIGDTNADYETACALHVEEIYLVAQGHQSYERLKALHENTYHSFMEITL